MAAVWLTLAACAGSVARDAVLLPAIQRAWPPIKEQAQEQAGTGPVAAIQTLDAAIALGTEAAIAGADWPAVKALATARVHARIAAKEIGPGVGQSLLERITKFDEAIVTYTARVNR